MAATVDFTSHIPEWSGDCISQILFFDRMKAELESLNTYVKDNSLQLVTLNQTNEPTQTEWEIAFANQTGLSLPIPPSAKLLWFASSTNTFGGEYGTIFGDTTVYRREHLYPKGATLYANSAAATTAQSITTDILLNNAVMPMLTFEIKVPFYLEVMFELSVTYAGTGRYGADFLINGVKAGTTYFGAPANYGIVNNDVSGFLHYSVLTPTPLDAGSYTIQSCFGVVGSPATPPTLTIGGTTALGARILTVRCIAA